MIMISMNEVSQLTVAGDFVHRKMSICVMLGKYLTQNCTLVCIVLFIYDEFSHINLLYFTAKITNFCIIKL